MQTPTQTRPMIEAGVLSAIAVIIACFGLYLGGLINFIWPVPIILLGVRHGLRWSIMATILSGFLTALFLTPVLAFMVVGLSGLTGIVLGYGIRQGFTPAKTILWGAGASLLSLALLVVGMALLLGIDPMQKQTQALNAAMTESLNLYRQMGMGQEKLAEMEALWQQTSTTVQLLLPAAFAFGSAVTAYINFWLSRIVLKRLGVTVEALPPFREWQMPKFSLYFALLAMAGVYWGQKLAITVLTQLSMNLLFFAIVFLMIQGLALFFFVANHYHAPRWLRILVVAMVFLNGFFMSVIILTGAIDMTLNYRRRLGQREP